MDPQLHFFTGENVYMAFEERKLWERRFTEKYGADDLMVLDAKGLQFRSLLDHIAVAPFLSTKRLFVIDGTPLFTKEEVEAIPNAIHPSCVLLIFDPSPDKRLSGVKAFLKICTLKEFPVLNASALQAWLVQEAFKHGSHITPDAAHALMAVAGEDQTVLAQEVSKLALYCGARGIEVRDVETLAVPSGDREVWHLSTLIAAGKRKACLDYVRELVERSEDPMALWNIVLWILRNLVVIAASLQEGQHQPARIVSQFRVPPQTVRTLMPLAERMPMSRIHEILSWAADAEVSLKQGTYRYTREFPQELSALLDRLLISLTEVSQGDSMTRTR